MRNAFDILHKGIRIFGVVFMVYVMARLSGMFYFEAENKTD